MTQHTRTAKKMAVAMMMAAGALTLTACSQDSARTAHITGEASRTAQSAADQYQTQTSAFPGNRTVIGTVEEIRSEQVKVDTGDMQARYVPLAGRDKKGLPRFQVGDRVILTLNAQNQLVDAHLDGESHEHKILRGKLAQPLPTGQDKAVIATQNGMEVSHVIRPIVRAKVGGIPVGAQVLFLIDEANQISDVTYENVAAAKAAAAAGADRSPLKNAFARQSGVIATPLHDNNIAITNQDGKEATYEVRPLAQARLKDMSKGDRIILLLDDENKVTDIAVPPMQ
ncbi:MAG: hypothetical protein U0172_12230 [Nitrospiraceae bacterium]